jgi:hypothetical protein
VYLVFTYEGIDESPSKILALIGALLSLAAWYTVRIVLSHYHAALKSTSVGHEKAQKAQVDFG